MFRKILSYIEKVNVGNLKDLAKFLKKDISIISDSINLLVTKGYLRNLNCIEPNPEIKFKCFSCSQKLNCTSNLMNRYELTPKGMMYLKMGGE